MLFWAALALAQTAPCDSVQAASSLELGECLDRIMRSAHNEPTVGDVLGKGLQSLRGKPQSTAFKKLGYPDKKMILAGSTVYSWNNTDTNIDGGALSCVIKVVTRRGMIIESDFHGNSGACAYYAQRFDPSFRLR